MPQSLIPEINKKCVLARPANRAWGFGDDSIIDDSPPDQQNLSAWPQLTIGKQNLHARVLLSAQQCHQMVFMRTSAITVPVYGGPICSWNEKKNSFTLADLLEGDEDQLQSLLYRFKTGLSITSEFRDKLIIRLTELLSDVNNDDVNESINPSSLRNFYNFVAQNNALIFPDISLTPDGDLFASWLVDDDKEFNIQFLSERDVFFALSVPNDRDPQRKIVISGEVTSDIILEKVRPYNILSWIMK